MTRSATRCASWKEVLIPYLLSTLPTSSTSGSRVSQLGSQQGCDSKTRRQPSRWIDRRLTWEILVPFLCQDAVHRLPSCGRASGAQPSAPGPLVYQRPPGGGDQGAGRLQPCQGGVRRKRDPVAGRRGEEWRLVVAQRAQDAEDAVQFTSDTLQRVRQVLDLVQVWGRPQIGSHIHWQERGGKRDHWEGEGDPASLAGDPRSAALRAESGQCVRRGTERQTPGVAANGGDTARQRGLVPRGLLGHKAEEKQDSKDKMLQRRKNGARRTSLGVHECVCLSPPLHPSECRCTLRPAAISVAVTPCQRQALPRAAPHAETPSPAPRLASQTPAQAIAPYCSGLSAHKLSARRNGSVALPTLGSSKAL